MSRDGDNETVERRLVALMCGTAASLHLTVLVGQRLVNAGFDLEPRLRHEVELATALGRQRGGAHELAT
ncbi:MAG: hypothetical protein ACXVH3_27450 [Solirubrobacteraceae bacterium]